MYLLLLVDRLFFEALGSINWFRCQDKCAINCFWWNYYVISMHCVAWSSGLVLEFILVDIKIGVRYKNRVLTWIWFGILVRCLNWLVMQLETTRKTGLCRDISNWLSEMMKSWASFWELLQLPMEVSYLTFTRHFFPRKLGKTRERLDLLLRSSKFINSLFFLRARVLSRMSGMGVLWDLFWVLVGLALDAFSYEVVG